MRQTRLAETRKIAELLSQQLKADRMPEVVRRPSQALGGRSIIEAVAAGDHAEILKALRAGFDWSSTA